MTTRDVRMEETGKACPYCRFPLKQGTQATECHVCGALHHTDRISLIYEATVPDGVTLISSVAPVTMSCTNTSVAWLLSPGNMTLVKLGKTTKDIDATLVPAPKQHNSRGEKELIEQGAMPADWKPAKRREKDLYATWTKKHGKRHFGYKLSINVDKKYKLIRKIETDTARTHDSQHFDNVFDTANTSRDVYADRGYPSAEREAWLKENGFRSPIQRKGHRNKPLSDCQQRRNTRIAKTRARVEHVFGAIEQMGGKLLRTIGQARANFAMTLMAACYNLKRLVYLQKAGIEAF